MVLWVLLSASLRLKAWALMSPVAKTIEPELPSTTLTVGVPLAVACESAMESSPPPALFIPALEVSLALARMTIAEAPLLPSAALTLPSRLTSVRPFTVAVGSLLGATLMRAPCVRLYCDTA